MKENHQQTWLQEPQHDYLFRSCKGSNQVNESAAHLWLKNSSFLLHAEGYLSVIQKEEIFTRSRKSKSLTNEHVNPNCRFCGNQKETMQHISASCPSLRASIQPLLRHNITSNVHLLEYCTKRQRRMQTTYLRIML